MVVFFLLYFADRKCVGAKSCQLEENTTFLDTEKRSLREVRIGTYDLSDVFGQNITFQWLMRCVPVFGVYRRFVGNNRFLNRKTSNNTGRNRKTFGFILNQPVSIQTFEKNHQKWNISFICILLWRVFFSAQPFL